MELERTEREGFLELLFHGRLDAYWSQHLAEAVGEVLREGRHAVRLNMSRTEYISSAGIGELVKLYKQFASVNGTFAVIEPSRRVRQVIEMVGLAPTLFGSGPEPATLRDARSAPKPEIAHRVSGDTSYEIHDYSPGAILNCTPVGHPDRLRAAAFSEPDCNTIDVSPRRMALGLGAFGGGFADCRDRFGEFLSVAGAAACQPTDGANYPDYMLASASFVPRISTLYGLACEGEFAKLIRFESAAGKVPATLSSILETCTDILQSESAGFVILAETAGLMGVQLKRSPVAAGDHRANLFAFPEIRSWLSFSPEHCHPRSLALIAGVVSANPSPALAPFVRSLRKASPLHGHVHAAAFGYRPLQKGRIDLHNSVRALFDTGSPEGVLHLLADDRHLTGGGETELLRGACWVGPIAPNPHKEVQS